MKGRDFFFVFFVFNQGSVKYPTQVQKHVNCLERGKKKLPDGAEKVEMLGSACSLKKRRPWVLKRRFLEGAHGGYHKGPRPRGPTVALRLLPVSLQVNLALGSHILLVPSQPSSSPPSSQSLSPSHLQRSGMQVPSVTQWNSSSLHSITDGSTETKVGRV